MAWEKTGFLFIKKPGPKVATLKMMASEIGKARQREAQLAEARPVRR